MATSRVEAEREAERVACIREFGFDPRTRRHPDAPRTREDCINGPRPCPWTACRLHLWLDIGKRSKHGHRSHVVKWHFRGLYDCPSEMPERTSCALDLADDHGKTGMTLGEIGAAWRLHPERVRQIEVTALRKVRKAFKRMGIDATWLDALALEVPESTFAQAMSRAAQVATELDMDVELPVEAPAGASKLLKVPRNGESKPPTTAVVRGVPAPTPVTCSAHLVRTAPLFL